MDLKEKINKQSAAGFSDKEIYTSLLAEGYSKEEIDHQFKDVSEDIRKKNQITPTGILMGCVFFILILFGINQFMNARDGGEALLYLLPIATGIILMIYWFSKKRG